MKPQLIKLALTAALLSPLAVPAQPPSNIAWTPETLNLVKKADASKGKLLAESCQSCHGSKGEGVAAETRDDEVLPAIPALAGQLATYTFKQLRDYADGSRVNDSMKTIAQGLNEQQAADVAAWFASLPKSVIKSTEKITAKAEKMVTQGDGKRILPPCSVCHGSQGQGEKMDIPALAGQQSDYFIRTLLAYKNGDRHNDVYSRMRLISQQLNEAEIKELAVYYRNLQ